MKRALLSVSDKTGITELGKFLVDQNIEILSTGGTAKVLEGARIKVKDVAEETESPEMLDGRVKTLHPKIHGAILGKRAEESHQKQMTEYGIDGIDMVVINLYPFEETVKTGASFDNCIEQIDIGGPAMVRSAAKNHPDVLVVTDPTDYPEVMEAIKTGNIDTAFRQKMAAKAFARTAAYDAAISSWFSAQLFEPFPDTLNQSYTKKLELRYGENPHQSACLYTENTNEPSIAHATQLQGKELSYNNIADTDAAFELVSEFTDEPACAIIKHANPCGVALGKTITDAYERAFMGDTVSAFGGILAFNQEVGIDLAKAMAERKHFVEVIIAPRFSDEAKEAFKQKVNLRLLETGAMPNPEHKRMLVKSVSGGALLQERDYKQINQDNCEQATKRPPTDDQWRDLIFAWKVCKHVKSNAIVCAKDGATIGIGAGQMSRVDSVKLAVSFAKEKSKMVDDAKGSVLASDAFFPFADGVEEAARAGVKAIIQPGGSKRDKEVIDMAEDHKVAMVMTGVRHFWH